jgi:hypothetical protein
MATAVRRDSNKPQSAGCRLCPQVPFGHANHGPLSYAQTISSRDGTQLFAVGTKSRGELVRYDAQSKQFVPMLSGISASDVSFSADGRWASYVSYPEGTLWRSRADGTERLQLTYPPMVVAFPFISPDGKRVAFWHPQC